jgi:hypothetical protein
MRVVGCVAYKKAIMLEDNRALTLACPKCGHIFEENIGGLKMKDSVICRRCTSVYMFDQSQFRAALDEARNAYRKLKQSLGMAKR